MAGNHMRHRSVSSTDIKYSLDFLRPIRTAEAFEAVAWLPRRTWPLVE